MCARVVLSLALLDLCTSIAFPQTYVYRIESDADDGTEVSRDHWYADGYLDSGLNRIGCTDGEPSDVGLRFQLPEVNAGDSFVYARLVVPGTGDGLMESAANLRIVGIALDGAPPFDTLRPSELPRTTAEVEWVITDDWPQPEGDYYCTPVYRHTPDISAIINEIVQRPGWGSGPDGKTLAIIIESVEAPGTNFLTFHDYFILQQGACSNSDYGPRPVATTLELYPSISSTFVAHELLGRPTDHAVTVNAMSLLPLEAYFEYGPGPGEYTQRTEAVVYPAETPIEAVLDGLPADARHYYRMRYRRPGTDAFLAGPEGTFHTQRARGEPFAFTVQTDSHMQNAIRGNRLENMALYRITLANVLADGPDFHIDLGDTFQAEHGAGRDTLDFEETCQRHLDQRGYLDELCHSAPFFSVLGNHEGEQGWRLDGTPDNLAIWAARARTRLYPLPVPDAFYAGNEEVAEFIGLREDYYAWEWGDALFVVLDPFWYTTRCPYGVDGTGWDWTLGETQYHWFEGVLANSSATFKFVFSHHMTGGRTRYGRGGIEAARWSVNHSPSYEWGGEDEVGHYVFPARRPGWALPIHQLMVQNNVSIWFHGHDHVFVKQDLDGIVYQECPKPSSAIYDYGAGDSYRYGDRLPNSGHLRVSVSATQVTVDYVHAFLPEDEGVGENGYNGDIAYSYTIFDCNDNGVPDPHDIASGASEDWNGNGVPDECECLGDLDGDLEIDGADLMILIASYGLDAGGDLDGDGDTDLGDLAELLGNFGLVCE